MPTNDCRIFLSGRFVVLMMDQSIRGAVLHSAAPIYIGHHHIDNLSRQTAELFLDVFLRIRPDAVRAPEVRSPCDVAVADLLDRAIAQYRGSESQHPRRFVLCVSSKSM